MTDSRKTIFLTGATGNMGREAVRRISANNDIWKLRILVRPEEKGHAVVREVIRHDLAEISWGDLTDAQSVRAGVKGADIVLHVGGLVSPLADRLPEEVVTRVNVGGARNIVDAIHAVGDPSRTRLVYIGTVAQTGSRNAPIHWGRAGDPIKISAYDHYAVTKTKAEAIIAESGILHWVSLRQSGMAHYEMWKIFDPIMFHNPLNGVFEWSTANDSGRLMAGVCDDNVPAEFWRGFYNIGGGESSRMINHKFMAATSPDFRQILRPHWFATRNFHGQWYSDSDRLQALVPFREQPLSDWLVETRRRTPWLVRNIPAWLPRLARGRIEALAKAPEGSLHWFEHGEEAKIAAYFGSRAAWEAIPRDWDDFVFEEPSRTPHLINHGYDEGRAPEEWTLEDLRSAAEFRGGKCLSTEFEGADVPVEWRSASGNRFSMTPRLYLKGGHWCPDAMLQPKNYAQEAERNPFFAQVWTQEAES
ncbi:NAD(P)-dependent oxidoreductase [Novosphingobium sp. P6W]|uniref:NAD-dependent epimerase/dehydratase family protein n=1 Tax=Novosphingobium sp. P6W TaxID=1609758 RepID=UPI0005C2F3DE|nr:NAD-dependent epimerase/dehydratase family protein [Novosphingobium sp. P6W]AXB80247.1 NAD-dependent epimerase/dehydratase family protein [Novosphingobium sp. P6W]KIS31587.1 epimerase [Novosphingobium sp. P6W]